MLRSQDLKDRYYNSEIDVFAEGLSSQQMLIADLLDQGIDFQESVRQIADRRCRGVFVDVTFDEYQKYLNYAKSDRLKVYSLALVAVYRCWHRCNETSKWPESFANLLFALSDLREFTSRAKVRGTYRFGKRDYEDLGMPILESEAKESCPSELIRECGLRDFLKTEISCWSEMVSCLKKLSPWGRDYASTLVSHLFWDFEGNGSNSIPGLRKEIQERQEYASFKLLEAQEALSKAYFFKGRQRHDVSIFTEIVDYLRKLDLFFKYAFPPLREKSLSEDYEVWKSLSEEKKWGGKIDAIFRVIEILEYVEWNVEYEAILIQEERKRAKDRAFVDGYMRKVRREMRKAFR